MSTFPCKCGIVWQLPPQSERMTRVGRTPRDGQRYVIPDNYNLFDTPNDIPQTLFLYRCPCNRVYAILIYDHSIPGFIPFRPDHNDPNHPTI